MQSDRFAVIDLGSNTFHLLICEVEDHQITTIFKERIYVKFASGGLDLIPEENIARGIDALVYFAQQIQIHQANHVRAIGTAALREARNGDEVRQRFETASGLHIEIIDGQREAQYILAGIRSAIPSLERPALIMDIGGGSVEFILYSGDHILYKGSFKIGVAVLYNLFHHHDPISTSEIAALESFVSDQLQPVFEAVSQQMPYYLIGASGSFEVIHDVMPRLQSAAHWAEMDLNGLHSYLGEVISTNLSDRRQIPEIPIERLDYIVVAYALIRLIMNHIPPSRLYYCDYALKEGVIAEMTHL